MKYISRFAPTASGNLHFGSLVAAVASYLTSYEQQGEWLLRIDDLDVFRVKSQYSDNIIDTLQLFGFDFSAVYYQSEHINDYIGALEKLKPLLFFCNCSRKSVMNCDCANCDIATKPAASRIKTNNKTIVFTDHLQGEQTQLLQDHCPNFVVQRADAIISYHLATVVDDFNMKISSVVRGADLMDSTARQIYLQQLLGYPTTSFLHIPVVINLDGDKLSKQTKATPLNPNKACLQLWHTLNFLDQKPDPKLKKASLNSMWQWAKEHWQSKLLPTNMHTKYYQDMPA